MPILLSKSLFAACVFFLVIERCPRDHIQLQKVDCKKENLVMTVTPTHVLRPGNQSLITVKVNVTCSGNPVNGAELSIKIGGSGERKFTTDANGNSTAQEGPFPVNLSGEKVSVVIEATDGPIEVTEKIPVQ